MCKFSGINLLKIFRTGIKIAINFEAILYLGKFSLYRPFFSFVGFGKGIWKNRTFERCQVCAFFAPVLLIVSLQPEFCSHSNPIRMICGYYGENSEARANLSKLMVG